MRKQLVAEQETDHLDKVANEADDALAGGGALSDVAQKYGMKLTKVENVDAGGRDLDGKLTTLPIDGKDVLKAAFDTNANDTSRIMSVEDSAIYAVHVDKVVAPTVKSLSDVKDHVVAAWQAEQKQNAVKKEASDLVAAVAAGTPLAQAASAKGLTATTPPPLPRRPEGAPSVPGAIIVKLFSAKLGDTVTADDAGGAYVAQLKEIKIPDTVPDAQAKALTTELGNSARYDMVGELTEALKKRFPVTIKHDVLDRMF